MSPAMLELLGRSFLETLVMTGAAGAISLALGLPLALLLVATDRGGIWERPAFNRALGAVVNAVRSVPFIILLVAVISNVQILFLVARYTLDLAILFALLSLFVFRSI